MTFLGFLMLVGLIGFLATLLIRMGPVYLDHYKVKASLESLKADRFLASRSKSEIVQSLRKRWEIDMIDSVSADNVAVHKHPDGMTVQIAYDVQRPIMGNVDVLMHFNDAIEVSSN